jgi:D-psicose/D-tagatose/L-ribulose 3-epimerase
MNKIGIFYAYWSRDWDVDFIPYLDKAANLGFDILEVNAGTLPVMSPGQRAALRKAAADRGLTLTSCVGLVKKYDISSEDAATQKNGVAFLRQIAAAAADADVRSVSGILYSYWPASIDKPEEKPRYVERSVRNMREAIKAAEDHGVVFNVEVVNRFEQFMLNTCDEALEYVARVGSPNLKILLDTYHMNIEEDDMCDAIERAGSKLGQLHIGESNRKPPSHGHMPWLDIGRTLRKMHFEGPVVMEPFLIPGGEVGRDIKIWRDIMPGCDVDAEAKRALDFMRIVLK